MSVLNKLASSLGRRDEIPNQELAGEISAHHNEAAVKELLDHLHHKDKDIQSDCIKVLYEIGELSPSLIAAYSNEFLDLLSHKNNRLQWGAMAALNSITLEVPSLIYASLTQIIDAADRGSVITKDHVVGTLIKLYTLQEFADGAFVLLNEQLLKSPTNQLPMYAEKALPFVTETDREVFINTLTSRLKDIEKESKRKRVERVIKKLQRLSQA